MTSVEIGIVLNGIAALLYLGLFVWALRGLRRKKPKHKHLVQFHSTLERSGVEQSLVGFCTECGRQVEVPVGEVWNGGERMELLAKILAARGWTTQDNETWRQP